MALLQAFGHVRETQEQQQLVDGADRKHKFPKFPEQGTGYHHLRHSMFKWVDDPNKNDALSKKQWAEGQGTENARKHL